MLTILIGGGCLFVGIIIGIVLATLADSKYRAEIDSIDWGDLPQ